MQMGNTEGLQLLMVSSEVTSGTSVCGWVHGCVHLSVCMHM